MAVIVAELQKHLSDLQIIHAHVQSLPNLSQLTEHDIAKLVEAELPNLKVSKHCAIGKLSPDQLAHINALREGKGLEPLKRRDIGIPAKRLPHIYAARIFRDKTPFSDLERTYRLALADESSISMESRPGIGINSLLISALPRQNFQGHVVIDRAVGNITRSGMFELRSAYGKNK